MQTKNFPANINQNNNFNLLRVLLAVSVIVSHAYPIAGGSGREDPMQSLTHGQISLGGMAVDGFFCISGFLITSSWFHSRSLWDYLKKRSLRIFPGLAGSLLFCILVVGPLGGGHLPGYFRSPQTWKFIQNLLLVKQVESLPGVFGHNPYRGSVDIPIWTIKYEFLCYLLVAAVAGLGVMRRRSLLLVFFLALQALLFDGQRVMTALHLHGSAQDIPRFISFFLAGALFYLWRESIPRSRWLLLVSAVILCASHAHFLTNVLPLAGTYVIFYVAYSARLGMPNFGKNWDLSYGLYLYGWPIEQLVAQYWPGIGPLGIMAASLPIAAGLAALSWRLIEQPALRKKSAPSAASSFRFTPSEAPPLAAGTTVGERAPSHD